MKFTKMQGAGNDFIVINNIEEKRPVDSFTEIAKILCQRRLSIGADGLMIVDLPEQGGDYKMHFINADGSIGEMCGNGARCIARYGYEKKLAKEVQKIETMSGMVIGKRINSRLYQVRLNNPTVIEVNHDVEVDGITYECSYVELGTPGLPHAVLPYKGLAKKPLKDLWDLGNKLRYHKDFKKGANVNFYDIVSEDEIVERTFERGVEDFTYACGTGSGSTALILTLQGKRDGKGIRLTMPGGELIIDVVRQEETITDLYLTGPTNIVADGIVLDEDLFIG